MTPSNAPKVWVRRRVSCEVGEKVRAGQLHREHDFALASMTGQRFAAGRESARQLNMHPLRGLGGSPNRRS